RRGRKVPGSQSICNCPSGVSAGAEGGALTAVAMGVRSVGGEDENGVVAAEAERVGDRDDGTVSVDNRFSRTFDVVKVETLFRHFIPDGRGSFATPEGFDRGDRLNRAGGAEQVADRRLGRADWDVAGALAEGGLDRLRLR